MRRQPTAAPTALPRARPRARPRRRTRRATARRRWRWRWRWHERLRLLRRATARRRWRWRWRWRLLRRRRLRRRRPPRGAPPAPAFPPCGAPAAPARETSSHRGRGGSRAASSPAPWPPQAARSPCAGKRRGSCRWACRTSRATRPARWSAGRSSPSGSTELWPRSCSLRNEGTASRPRAMTAQAWAQPGSQNPPRAPWPMPGQRRPSRPRARSG